MAFGLQLLAAAHVLQLLTSALAAALVLLGGRRERRSLLLGLFFVLSAANVVLILTRLMALPPWWEYNLRLYELASFYALPFVYLAFLGAALETPLVRPLRPRWVSVALVTLGPILVFAATYGVVAAWAANGTPTADGPARMALEIFNAAVYAYALLATFSMIRRSPAGSLARRRAVAYAWAFVTQDVGFLLYFGIVGPLQPYFLALNTVSTFALALASVLLMRALLREKLFDFDLKLKWTLRRGTLVSAFVAAFFVAAAVAEQYLQRYGVLVGGIAVGILLFALRPLERAADRLADATMPRVQDTEEYRLVRKREVYRAAVEGALEDGGVSDKERAMLARLADQLGLGATEALAIEREARNPAT